jgi:hypothetical protein
MSKPRKRRIAKWALLIAGLNFLLIAAATQRIRVLHRGTTPIGAQLISRFHVRAAMYYVSTDPSVRFELTSDQRHYDPHIELFVAVGGENHFECDLIPADRELGEK